MTRNGFRAFVLVRSNQIWQKMYYFI